MGTLEETIFERIASHALRTPHSVALESRGRSALSYEALERQIRTMVQSLNASGAGRGDRIAIVLPTGPEMATACLSVTAGAIALPLNPEYREAEFEAAFASLEPKVLLIQAEENHPARVAARARGIATLDVVVDSGTPAGCFRIVSASVLATASLTGMSSNKDLALILQTSGTTSRPKNVPLTHRNLAISTENLVRSLGLTSKDRVLHLLPMFHIGGFIDVLAAPLTVGGTVICTTGFSSSEFFSQLETSRPTWTQAVPAMIQEMVTVAETRPASVKNHSLRLLRSVSAPLPTRLMEEFEGLFQIPVIEIFGMTEAAGVITSNPLPPEARIPGSVGVPAGTRIRILDPDGSPLPPGRIGEVSVQGDSITEGYEGLPEENARAFQDRWFRTGDQGYLDEKGYLFLTGRMKDIINRGGEKVSPHEVDAVMNSHPCVAETATFPIPHESLGEDVAVAVVLKPGSDTRAEDLRSYLKGQLAYFKVPRVVHLVDFIPRGANGKLQRGRLAEALNVAALAHATVRRAFIAPANPVARSLAKMWESLLTSGPVGMEDDFFSLGGDSLKAARFINELQQMGGEVLYVSAVFDAPTLAKFEQYLRQHYPDLVAKILGESLRPATLLMGETVTPAKVAQLRASITCPSPFQGSPGPRNARAIFVLSPPRSGSTLLRVLLGGHPKLFAPPELYLLSYENLAERKAYFDGSQRFQLEGNIRCLMQILDQPLEEIQSFMADLEERRTPTHEYYHMLQEWLGERILVDKTPAYAIHVETMRRAEEYFQDPLYVHLLRHPYGMIRSFEEARLEQLWYHRLVGGEASRRSPCPWSRRELAEMIWLVLHQNILDFLHFVPEERQFRLRFEDLVSQPQQSMEELCRFIGLEFAPSMVDPQKDNRERMADGIHPTSRMIGDMKFHQHEKIDADVADQWKSHYDVDFLSEDSRRLASDLGYDQTVANQKGREEFEI